MIFRKLFSYCVAAGESQACVMFLAERRLGWSIEVSWHDLNTYNA